MKNKTLILVMSFIIIFTCCFLGASALDDTVNWNNDTPNIQSIDLENDFFSEIHFQNGVVYKLHCIDYKNKVNGNCMLFSNTINDFIFNPSNAISGLSYKCNLYRIENGITTLVFNNDSFIGGQPFVFGKREHQNNYYSEDIKEIIIFNNNNINTINIKSDVNYKLVTNTVIPTTTKHTTTKSTTIVDTTSDNTNISTSSSNSVDNDVINNSDFSKLEHIFIFFGLLFFTMSFINIKSKGSVIDV